MPYYDNVSINFLRNKTDTVIFVGGKVITGYTDGYTQDECPVLVHCQYKSQKFADNQNNIFSLKYFVTPPNEGESPGYSINFNQDYFGDYSAENIYALNITDTTLILGKPYVSPYKMIYNGDTIYFRNGIVRIKYQNTIYEKIP